MAELEIRTEAVSETTEKWTFKQAEFLVFSIVAFIGKSALLVRLPYRTVDVNAFYTCSLLLLFYCYFRFRYKLTPPGIVVFFLAMAVAVDVMGNFFHLYGKSFGPVQFDEFTHFMGSAASLPPTFWLLRATTRKFGHRLPLDLLAFLAVTITFSFCAYYEILELWDEEYFGGKRLWSAQDSANDLQWDLAGIIASALATVQVMKFFERRENHKGTKIISLLFLIFVPLWFSPLSYAQETRETVLKKVLDSAKEQTKQTLKYDSSYVKLEYPGGDPPIEGGVCSDVIVRAFRKGGIDLQKEVHEDIRRNFSTYPKLWGAKGPDRNIDHRRVANLMTYFDRKGKSLPITSEWKDYQPGDIVAWRLDNGLYHIGIVSNIPREDKKSYYIIHNIGDGTRVEDVLFSWKIIGHYRYF